MKKVFKYGTGHPVPEGAVYLSTSIGKTIEREGHVDKVVHRERTSVLVWHYFLVETEE